MTARPDNPYPPGTVTHRGFARGVFEAFICSAYDVPMSLVIPEPKENP